MVLYTHLFGQPVIDAHINWDTLYSIVPVFIGTPCIVLYPYMYGQPVIDAHIYWDTL